MLETQLPMGGLTWLVLISTVYSTISSTLSCFSTSSSQPSLTWRRLWKRTGVSRHLSDTFDLPLRCLYTCRFNGVPGSLLRTRRETGAEASYDAAGAAGGFWWILAHLRGFARG